MDLRKKLFLNKGGAPAFVTKKSSTEVHPRSWEGYFDERVELPTSGYCVYKGGEKGPIVLLLHGCGQSALSWALVAKKLKEKCKVFAFDFRCHGGTKIFEEDMSAKTLVNDSITVLKELFPNEETIPSLSIFGHSMGGAIAVHLSLALPPGTVESLGVVDVVEGTALEALPKMKSIVHARPNKFLNLEDAIQWALQTGQVRNVESACVSIPPQLKEIEIDGGVPTAGTLSTVYEEQTNQDSSEKDVQKESEAKMYVWKTDLLSTAPYWKGWFTNLSEMFLSVAAPKLLLIANTNRLDTPLTIGQMQGKFQMSLLPSVGHSLQEDSPDQTAELLLQFMNRFRLFSEKPSFLIQK